MDHFRYPRNKVPIKNPNFSSGQINPSCGDKVSIDGTVCDNKITEIYFDGVGCVISQATASILTEHCIGKTLNEILDLSKDNILKMIGIKLGPVRIKCALLPLQALQAGILTFLNKQKNK